MDPSLFRRLSEREFLPDGNPGPQRTGEGVTQLFSSGCDRAMSDEEEMGER
jgi:hypothetical protein